MKEFFRIAAVIAALMPLEPRLRRTKSPQDIAHEKALSKKARVREQIRARKAQKEQV